METLQDIKNNYAQEQDYEGWRELIRDNCMEGHMVELYMNEICIRAQKAALEKAYESINADDVIKIEWGNIHKSITNPENLIK